MDRRDGERPCLHTSLRMRVCRASTHKKASGSQVPCEGQAKAHVGFHLRNVGNACGSFQWEKRGKSDYIFTTYLKLLKKTHATHVDVQH